MDQPIILHINYCEQGQTIPEACQKAAGWGYDGIELRGRRLDVQEPAEAYLDLVAGAIQRSGLKHVLFGYPTADMMLPDAAARAREVERDIHFYRQAKQRLGDRFTLSNTFTGALSNPDKSVPGNAYERHGSACATAAQWQAAVEGFRLIGDAVAEIGVRLAFETHMHYLHDTPMAAKKLVDLLAKPAIGVNLDYANFFCFPQPAPVGEVVKALGSSLFYVHLKNLGKQQNGDHLRLGLADGDINNREFVRALMQSGYRGFLCVEAPRPGDREWFAQQDLAYIRAVLRDLNRESERASAGLR
jgi:sugar phosphate isomerase/epimerase